MTGLTVEEITAKFPHKSLPKILGEPSYETIHDMIEKLYANAASLQSPLGGGRHGHIGLLMSPQLYQTLSTTAYTAPTDPGEPPKFDDGFYTDQQRRNGINEHTRRTKLFTNHTNMDEALKNQIIASVQDAYLLRLKNRYTGYMSHTARDMLQHLLARYGKIMPSDLDKNVKTFNEPMDPTQAIDVYLKRLEDCCVLADDAGVPYTIEQLLSTAYFGIQSTGLYRHELKEWRKLPEANRTWPNFKDFFSEAYQDLQDDMKFTAREGNYHSANNVTSDSNKMSEISDALNNLALAATADKSTFQQLLTENSDLKLRLSQLENKLTQLVADTTDKESKRKKKRAEYEARLNPNGYCHSCGYKVVYGHDSMTCRCPKEGHKREATRANPMGGSTRNNNWRPGASNE